MPQVEKKIERKPKDRLLAVGLAGVLMVLVVGGVLVLKFWPKSVPKMTISATLESAEDKRAVGDTDGAIALLKQQFDRAKTDDDKTVLLLSIGGAYENAKNYDEALTYYQKAAAIEPGYATNAAIAQAATHAGKTAVAIDYYKRNKDLITTGKAPRHQGDLTEVEAELKDLGAE